MFLNLAHYTDLLGQIKLRIRQGQSHAVLSANACGKIGNLEKNTTARGTN